MDPIEIADVTSFFKPLTGEEEFQFNWDVKPEAMVIYTLEGSYPEYCKAKGFLLPINIPSWEKELASGRYTELTPYLEEFIIGQITLELGGNIKEIKIKAEPLKL